MRHSSPITLGVRYQVHHFTQGCFSPAREPDISQDTTSPKPLPGRHEVAAQPRPIRHCHDSDTSKTCDGSKHQLGVRIDVPYRQNFPVGVSCRTPAPKLRPAMPSIGPCTPASTSNACHICECPARPRRVQELLSNNRTLWNTCPGVLHEASRERTR